MPKITSVKQYDKAQELWTMSNISQSNIARLCEIPRSTLNVWVKKWEARGIKRPVDKSAHEAIDKLLEEE